MQCICLIFILVPIIAADSPTIRRARENTNQANFELHLSAYDDSPVLRLVAEQFETNLGRLSDALMEYTEDDLVANSARSFLGQFPGLSMTDLEQLEFDVDENSSLKGEDFSASAVEDFIAQFKALEASENHAAKRLHLADRSNIRDRLNDYGTQSENRESERVRYDRTAMRQKDLSTMAVDEFLSGFRALEAAEHEHSIGKPS